jgi:hypothetical protein
MVVEVRHVLGQHCRKIAAVDAQRPVQQFPANSPDPSFGDLVRLRCLAPGCGATQAPPGLAVTPSRCTQRVACFHREQHIKPLEQQRVDASAGLTATSVRGMLKAAPAKPLSGSVRDGTMLLS